MSDDVYREVGMDQPHLRRKPKIAEPSPCNEFLYGPSDFEARIEVLERALEAAAQAIKDWDEGDPEDPTGWKHDELREAWVAARAALGIPWRASEVQG